MLTAEKIVETFQATTGEMSLDEAVERLIVLAQFEQAIANIESGHLGIPHAQVTQEMKALKAQKWATYHSQQS